MTAKELKKYIEIIDELPEADYQELIRLNHLIKEMAHDIHNTNMLRGTL